MSDLKKEFLKGFIRENPVFVLLLGMCPTLGVSSSAANGLGMGLATTAVLLGSNIVVSLVKNVIPDKVRIPSYIVIIASFVTIIDLTMAAYVPALHAQLGLFIPLIVVNCIILGRAEAFAGKNGILASIVDALGMGLGFAFALTLLGSVREILGNGSIFGASIPVLSDNPILIFIMPAGAFLALGFLIAAVNGSRNRFELAAAVRAGEPQFSFGAVSYYDAADAKRAAEEMAAKKAAREAAKAAEAEAAENGGDAEKGDQ